MGASASVPRVLVAGIGNMFFADDGFGGEVARRLATRAMPEGVRVEDYGIRGVHLAYELLDGYDALVLIDAVPMHEPPGTVAVIEPEMPDPQAVAEAEVPLDAHTMNPAIVLQTLAKLGGHVDQIVLVGCQPDRIEASIGLSPTVEAAVGVAADEVGVLLEDLCRTREETRA